MELIANLRSSGWKETLADAVAYRATLGDISSQLDSLAKAKKITIGGAAPAGGGSAGGRAAPGPDKAAKERAAAEKYVAGIKDRYFASEQKRQEKEEKDAAKAAAKKAKDQERAAKAGSAKSGSSASGSASAIGDASSKLVAAAKFAAVGIGASYVGQLALGYQGVARLQGITARAQLNLRKLFSGVNPKPFLDTFERVSLLFSKQTSTGKALAGIFSRTFNGLGAGVKSNESLITGFLKGIVIGALRLENVWLRARIALLPLTSAVGKFVNQVGVGSNLGQLAFGYMTIRALGLTSVVTRLLGLMLRLGGASAGLAGKAGLGLGGGLAAGGIVGGAVALGAVVNEVKKENEELKEPTFGGGSFGGKGGGFNRTAALERKRKEPAPSAKGGGLTSLSAVIASAAEKGFEQSSAAASGKGVETASAAGKGVGAALGDGVVAGIFGVLGKVQTAGGDLAKAAEKGVKEKAEIKSPSKMMARSGAFMGQGVALGIREQAGAVQSAAEEALVPNVAAGTAGSVGASGGGKGSGFSIQQIGPFHFPNYAGDANELASIIGDEIDRHFRDAARTLGIDPGGAS